MKEKWVNLFDASFQQLLIAEFEHVDNEVTGIYIKMMLSYYRGQIDILKEVVDNLEKNNRKTQPHIVLGRNVIS